MNVAFRVGSCFILGVLLGTVVMGGEAGQAVASDPPEETVQRALSTVDSLRTQRDFRAALARLHEVEQTHSESVEVLWRRSILWNDLGKEADTEGQARNAYRQGVAVAEQALEVDSESAWAHLAKAVAAGRLATVTGSNKESIRLSRDVKEHVDRAIDLDETLAAAYHVRGRWHREIADLNFLQRMVVKTVYGGLPEASMEQAVQDFTSAIELEQRTYHHLELGKTHRAMGNRSAAREELRAALSSPWADPFDPEYKQEARRHLAELS